MESELAELSVFALVVEEKSFTRAGVRLGLSQSAVSHMMRRLEAKLGIELLARTTRSVSPTVAGAALLQGLTPALRQIEESLASVRSRNDRPVGRIRLVLSQAAARLILYETLANFVKRYPEIELDVTATAEAVDIITEGFDAGIHLGEFIDRDMIAVRVSPSMELAVVGSPAYFQRLRKPRSPAELKEHQCIAMRLRKGAVYRWEFSKGTRSLTVTPNGPLVCSDPDLAIEAACQGLGLVMTLEPIVAPKIIDGSLVRVLADWCPPFPGYFLYYPSRRNQSFALKALIETLRV